MPRLLVFLLSCCFALAACGPGNTIRLQAPPVTQGAIPKPNASTVTVVAFADKRDDTTSVGERRDGTSFSSTDNTSRWICLALAEELRQHNLQVSYADTFEQARKALPDYLIRGEVERVWLKEESTTAMNTHIRVNFNMANKEKRVLRETVNSNQSRTGLPSNSAAEELLRNTLQDLVQTMTQKILQRIKK